MAEQYTAPNGTTITVPGTYVQTQVISNNSGTAAGGVIAIIGEANAGPDYTQEDNLDGNSYGPSDINLVIQKYQSGRIVDAFNACIAASADPAITGSVTAIKIVKTNPSTYARYTITRPGFGTYATLQAQSQGAQGNLITYTATPAQAEVAPSTGAWTYAPLLTGTATLKLRNNGAAQKTVVVSALTSGPTLAAQIEDYTNGFLCHGGLQTQPLTGLTGQTLTAVASGQTLVVSLPPGQLFATTMTPGNTIVIPLSGQYGAAANSAIAGAGNANVGSYVVTGVVNTLASAMVTLQALVITGSAPVSASGAIAAGATDITDFSPVTIENVTGQNRNSTSGSATYTTTSNDGTNVVMSTSVVWAAQPQVGDTMVLPTLFAGVTAGFYMVTASTATTVSFSRLSNGTAGTTGAFTGTATFTCEKPDIDGVGKTMEAVGATPYAYTSTGTPATWANTLMDSAAEYEVSTTISNGPNVTNTFTSGGNVALQIGCINGSATAVVSATGIVFTSSSGTFTTTTTQYTTLASLVSYLNSQTGYTASLGSAAYANAPLSSLDYGTYTLNCDPSLDDQTCRIKNDASTWVATVNSGLAAPLSRAASGLPGTTVPAAFLAGGTLAGTTSMAIANAFTALLSVTCNFVVPCFSVDASVDIAAGQTDPSSTYTIDAINALCKNHVIDASAYLARQNRIGFASKDDTYVNQAEAAQELAYFRMMFCMQDQILTSASGVTQTYQSWMSCVLAAGEQAAAGFRGIVKKYVNTQGALQPRNDFNVKNYGAVTAALEAGILFMEPVTTGGWRWVSDQTTYSLDNNFVYNSMQAVYVSDLMALQMIQVFDNAVVGKSIAEISAAGAMSLLISVMFNFLRLKWTAPSTDAPSGYKNASITIEGPVMTINVEAKINGLIYFVPINFSISEVTQTATSAG